MSYKRIVVLGATMLLSAGILAPNAAAQTRIDVDFDFILHAVDHFLNIEAPGQFPSLKNADRAGNGINDDDQLAMLSAVLLNNSPNLQPPVVNDIQIGFNNNRVQVRQDLIISVSVVGFSETINVIQVLESEDPLFAFAVEHLLAGYMTTGDQAQINFLNGFLRNLVEFFVNREGYGFLLGLINLNDLVNFQASQYATFGDGVGQPNYLGAQGNIAPHLKGTTNKQLYDAAGGTFKREDWLTNSFVTPPVRIISGPTGGSAQTGDQFPLSITIAGGSGSLNFQWLRTDSAGFQFPNSFQSVGTNTQTYTIPYVETADNATFLVAVSDNVSIYNPSTRLGGRRSWITSLNVTQVPFQVVSQPQGGTFDLGDSHALEFRVRGGAVAPTYQWTRNDQPVGGNALTLDLSPITGSASGVYRCVANSGGNVLQSNPVSVTVIGAGDPVEFADPNLDALMREILGFDSLKEIFEGDLVGVTTVTGHSRNIQDLSGIDKLPNLQRLDLWNNAIENTGPIANLVNLRELNLARNNISNVGPLANLVEVEQLILWDNQLVNPEALLDAGLASNAFVGLEGNPLNEAALCETVPALEALGVQVGYDGECPDFITEGEFFEGEGEDPSEGEPDGEIEGEEGEGEETFPECDLVFESNGDPIEIESGEATMATINVGANRSIADLNVTVNLTHDDLSRLMVVLRSPSGIQTILFSRPTQGGQALAGTEFNDESPLSIETAQPPYDGVFSPVLPLSVFDGENMQGEWELQLLDDAVSDNGGLLLSWRLDFNPCDPEEFDPVEGEAPDDEPEFHAADVSEDWNISLSELLRVVQFFNAGRYHCDATTEDGYAPGLGDVLCRRHSADFQPPSFVIALSEMLRLVQLFNAGEYHWSPGTEDGFAPGPPQQS